MLYSYGACTWIWEYDYTVRNIRTYVVFYGNISVKCFAKTQIAAITYVAYELDTSV